jgi:NAD(P)-dependent dehydrogenase (short-subunit alcohol dehydrogenase family)
VFRSNAVEADLATTQGVDTLYAAIGGRPVEALLANAGRGLGKGFLDQDFDAVRRVVDTNITGTLYLLQKVGLAKSGPRYANAGTRPHPDHRFDRWFHAGDVSGGV